MKRIDTIISAAFRSAFEAHPQSESDPALALDSARESASALVPRGMLGSFDDETLTFRADSRREYQIFEQGQIVARIEAASARGALRAAARKLPRHAADYNMVPWQEPYWETWRACLPGEDFEAAAQVLIPASGTLRGAGRSVYRAEEAAARHARQQCARRRGL